MSTRERQDLYREIPSVDAALQAVAKLREAYPHDVLTREIRCLQEEWRAQIREYGTLPPGSFADAIETRIGELESPSLRAVINASGVVLHTNLGRAPLAKRHSIAGYSNLEYDLERGLRGKRDVHAGRLLERLLGKPAIVVNNNAAATYLVLRELAAGMEVIISRGELVEIGDGFRVPEIMEQAGVILREVGATNRTHLADYERAINERTALIVRVHASNFRMEGFTGRPALGELTALAHAHGIPLYDDLGSGNLVDLSVAGVEEPIATRSFEDGADVVSFSADKLLGGPQAGVIAGRADLVARLRRNPMYRAFRPGKLVLEPLEQTLRALYFRRYEEIPALQMTLAPAGEVETRARAMATRLQPLALQVEAGRSMIGGGSTPEQSIPTWLLVVPGGQPDAAAAHLRRRAIPIVCRIERDCLVFDLRTVFADEEPELESALRDLWQAGLLAPGVPPNDTGSA